MKKIKEKFTIIERLLFLLTIIVIAIIIIPIIQDNIEQPKIDNTKNKTEKYIEIVNSELIKIKEDDEELFNEVIKYNSFSKFCTIEEQIIKCGDNEIKISNKEIIPEVDSIIYFSNEGNVAGYKIIVDGYRVTYPNSKNLTTIKKYKPKAVTTNE